MEDLQARLGRWILREKEAAVCLSRLGLTEAARQARKDTAWLQGVLRLMGEGPCRAETVPRITGTEATARRLYGESLRLRQEYEAFAEDPEYGCIFSELVKRKTQRCLTIAAWLGQG